MPLILLLIVGISCLVIGGAWAGTIIDDIQEGNSLQLQQIVWTVVGIAFGIFCIIACIGHVAAVK